MPSELFQNFGAPAQQNPRDAAMSLLRQQGIQVPHGMENNPNAILNHLMQSGRIPQGRLNMAQQMMQRMFRR
jgi:mannitol/fructose-specific phosphotransferase system IIA component